MFKVNGVAVPAAGVTQVGNTWSFQFEPNLNGQQLYTIEVTATDGATNTATDSIQVSGVKTGKKKP